METIINNPGLQHLAEKVFLNLDVEDLKNCEHINQSCKQILENPMFWLKKFGGSLSKKNEKDWVKIIQSVKNFVYEKLIISYLKCNLKKEIRVVNLLRFWFEKFRSLSKKNQKYWIKVIASEKNFEREKAIMCYLIWNLKNLPFKEDVPCYSSPAVQDKFRKKIWNYCNKIYLSNEDIKDLESLEILAHLTDNPTAPVFTAAANGHTEIVKILAPFINDPNASYVRASTMMKLNPISSAATKGHIEIVKILAPLTDNPNASDINGVTPISWATHRGQIEVVKILAPLTDTPNAPNGDGVTPIFMAAMNGHTEIVKILAPLTDNPNAPDKNGETPIFMAAMNGHTEIIKLLAPLIDNSNSTVITGVTPFSVAKNDEIRSVLKSFKTSNKRKTSGLGGKPSKKQAKASKLNIEFLK